MSRELILPTAVILIGGIGTWLLLPHRHGKARSRTTQAIGTLMAIGALLLMGAFYTPLGDTLRSLFFYGFATAALSGAILTITSRDPVYSALWFASVVLSTSGLFLLAGAQFLAAGTIIVYAGAIIVTFLFVIMLAQSHGQAVYDRMARAPGAAALSGFGLLWAVFYAVVAVPSTGGPASARGEDRLRPASTLLIRTAPDGKVLSGSVYPDEGPGVVLRSAIRPTALLGTDVSPAPGVPPAHVAGLGGTLFTDHLLAVELAGALLFVALVGAISMAAPRPPVRPPDRSAAMPGDIAQARNLANSSL